MDDVNYHHMFMSWWKSVCPSGHPRELTSNYELSFIAYWTKADALRKELLDNKCDAVVYIRTIRTHEKLIEVSDHLKYDDIPPPLNKDLLDLYEMLSIPDRMDILLNWQRACLSGSKNWREAWYSPSNNDLRSIWIKLSEPPLDIVNHVEIIIALEKTFRDLKAFGLAVSLVPPPIEGFENLYITMNVMDT